MPLWPPTRSYSKAAKVGTEDQASYSYEISVGGKIRFMIAWESQLWAKTGDKDRWVGWKLKRCNSRSFYRDISWCPGCKKNVELNQFYRVWKERAQVQEIWWLPPRWPDQTGELELQIPVLKPSSMKPRYCLRPLAQPCGHPKGPLISTSCSLLYSLGHSKQMLEKLRADTALGLITTRNVQRSTFYTTWAKEKPETLVTLHWWNDPRCKLDCCAPSSGPVILANSSHTLASLSHSSESWPIRLGHTRQGKACITLPYQGCPSNAQNLLPKASQISILVLEAAQILLKPRILLKSAETFKKCMHHAI